MAAMTLDQGSDWLGDDPAVREGDAVLAAAEGGDRVLRLLAARPRRVTAIDRRLAQLHLLELKLAAVKTLPRGEVLEFLGHRPSRRRRALYPRLRWLLPRESDDFWIARIDLVDRGVASQGEFERRLASFRRLVRLIHGRAKVERFLTLGNEASRRAMYAAEWRTFLWRRFGPALWSRWFDVPASHLERLLFEGRLLAAAPEPGEAEFEAAKELANRVLVVHEPPEIHLRSLPSGSIDAFALGRMDLSGLEAEIARVARPGARATLVTERAPDSWSPRFVPVGPPRDAGFFPGQLIFGSFLA